jgi:hypothetical protein
MDKSELLSEFKAQLASFDKYRTFIDKARSYAERFNPAVVEKVIADNTAKIAEVSSVLDPLVAVVRGELTGVGKRREAVLAGVEEARLQVEELNLRLMIDEISSEEHAEATAGPQRAILAADDQVAELDLEASELSEVLEQWLANRPDTGAVMDEPEAEDDLNDDDLGDEDVVDDEIVAAGDDGGDLLGELEEDEDVDLRGDEEDEIIAFEDAEDPGESGVHAVLASTADDVSAVFEEAPAAEEEAVLEGGEAAGIDFRPGEIDEIGADLFSEPVAQTHNAGEPESRAMLVMGEGTSEEHVYPLVGDVLSIGRGRDNNVQVKNDSKVSRYHCKLFKRDGHYFISDNKSANGSLVDGELVKEKRLVGGEEVIIGETFFRFRIER